MPNTINHAEKWSDELLEIYQQETLISPFITTNVNWLDAKTFHFTQMSTSGYKDHSQSGGWNRGTFVQTDVPFTVNHDRDVEFLVDKREVDESNATASIKNISKVFTRTQAAPESNAYFFSKIAQTAKGLSGYNSSTDLTSYTAANVYSKIKSAIGAGKLRRYKAKGALICYVRSEIMDLLEISTEINRKIEMTQIAEGGIGIKTRITDIDGVPIMEVIDDEVFYDYFDFNGSDGGFEPVAPVAAVYTITSDVAVDDDKTYYTRSGSAGSYTYTAVDEPKVASIASYYELTTPAITGSHKINMLIASPLTSKYVPKIASIYSFAPGTHTQGDGYLYQNRSLSDVFTFPNGKNGQIDSVYVDIGEAAE